MEEARRDAGVSDPNLDVIEEVNDRVAAGDTSAIVEHLHADVVWEQNLGVGSPEEGVYEGREAVIRLFERIVEPWEYLRLRPSGIDRLDEDSYLIKGEMHAKHATSAVEIVVPYEQRVEMRDGLLLKGQMTTGALG